MYEIIKSWLLKIKEELNTFRNTFFFSWLPEFGFILQYRNHVEPFWDRRHWRRGSVKSILRSSLVRRRSRTWETKAASTNRPALWSVSSPFALLSYSVKTLHTGFLQNDSKSGAGLEFSSHINQTWGCAKWHCLNTWQEIKCELHRKPQGSVLLRDIWFQIYCHHQVLTQGPSRSA